MATLYLDKKSGAYYVNYRVNGQRVRRRVGKDKKAAEKYLKSIEARLTLHDPGLAQEKKDMSLAEYFGKFRKHVEVDFPESQFTQANYLSQLGFLERFLAQKGITKLSQVTAQLLQEFKLERHQGCVTASSLNSILRIMSTIFSWGAKVGLLEDNPARKVERVKLPPQERQVFTWGEIKDICAALPQWLRDVFGFALYTGLRKRELQFLCWDAVDLAKDVFYVKPQPHLKFYPKGRKARTVPLHPEAKAILQSLPRRGERVFSTPKGRPICDLQKRLKPFFDKLGIRKTLHSTRHTFCTALLQYGVSLSVVAKIAGHSSTKVTEIYAHLAESHVAEGVQRLTYGPRLVEPQMVSERSVNLFESQPDTSQRLDLPQVAPACVSR